MNFNELIEEEKAHQRENNITTLRNEINKSWVEEKLNNFLERYKYSNLGTVEELKNLILADKLVASFFIKDPSKQNITEKAVARLLKVDKMPASGSNSVCFNESGELVHSTSNRNSKSADFYFNNIYWTQKYTTSSGGHQDNQRHDVVKFLEYGSKNYKVGALLDGDYWVNHINKLKEDFKNNDNVIILSCEDILNGKYKIEQ